MSARTFRAGDTAANGFYPRLLGRSVAISAHHYLAAHAAAELLRAGGNAVDGAIAATFVEGLVDPQMHSLGGECPMLICLAGERRVWSVNGNTAAPLRATPQAYRERGLTSVPAEGILAAGVPAAFASLVTALRRFGRLRFRDVAAPASNLAKQGFPLHRGLIAQEGFGLTDLAEKFRHLWPTSAELYLPGGRVPKEGSLQRNPALHDLLESAMAVERRHTDRDSGLAAVMEFFYRGEPAAAILAHAEAEGGLLSSADFTAFRVEVEDPIWLDYAGHRLFKCGPWNQGPALLLSLGMLQAFDLRALRHNGPDYVHLLVEATKLAYADRNQYFGDPAFVQVPLDGLFDPAYHRARAGLIEIDVANAESRPGDPLRLAAQLSPAAPRYGSVHSPGTVHVDVIDAEGNMAAFTPSGGWLKSSPVVAALGFPLTNRLMTFHLGPAGHPNVLQPGKRPRTTISPSLTFADNGPAMVFGSMGGDQQDQWQLQFFLNVALFGMTLQAAVEAPKFSSSHFEAFFAPHDWWPSRVRIEPRIGEEVVAELSARGHDVEIAPDWTEGFLAAAALWPDSGLREAACDPRGVKSEIFAPGALCW